MSHDQDSPTSPRGYRVELLTRWTRDFSPGVSGYLGVVAFFVIVLAVWQISSMYLPLIVMPSPARIAWRFGMIWTDPNFIGFALTTLYHVVVSVLIAFALGVSIAILAYFIPALDRAIYGRLAPFLNSFSGIGKAFLAIVWFGVSHEAVIFAAANALLPFAIINAGTALRELDREMVEMSVSFSRSSWRRTLLVIVPMMSSYLLATFRLCSAIGFHIVPTAELLTGSGGIGSLISLARQRYWTDMIFAVAFLMIFAVFVTDRLIFARIQKRLRKSYGL